MQNLKEFNFIKDQFCDYKFLLAVSSSKHRRVFQRHPWFFSQHFYVPDRILSTLI